MADITISAGVSSSGIVVNVGDNLIILSGGIATDTTENGGNVVVNDGGTADFASNTITGLENVTKTVTVHKNTVANENTFEYGGAMKVYDGGIASGNIVNGNVDVYSGAKVYGTTASVGEGHFTVYGGGYAENIVFNCHWRWGSGLSVLMNATVTGTTVFGDGRMFVSAGATANDTLQVGGSDRKSVV